MILLFVLISSFIQWQLPLHGDVSYLIYVSQLLLDGGTYSKPFYETNPPMILYLYFPVAMLAKYHYFFISLLLKTYVTLLALLSALLSDYMLRKLVTNHSVRYSIVFGILVALFILPASQFGQREHLFLILLLPYLFSICCLLENKKLNPYLLTIIGLLASFGFCIKPYFVYLYLFINASLIYQTKQLTKLLYLPTVIIGIMLPFYLISTYILFPEYFSTILPLVYQFYIDAISEPWLTILINPLVLYCFSIFIIYCLFYHADKYPSIGLILASSLIGAMLAFLVTKTTWFYHLIPAIGLAFILLSFFIGQLLKSSSTSMKVVCLIILIPLLLPMLNIVTILTLHSNASSHLKTITNIIQTSNGPRSISCFSMTTTRDCFPLTTDTNSQYATRYPFFWWLRGLMKSPSPDAYLLLTNTVAEDLKHYRPRWILVNSFHAKYMIGKHFDFIQFFSDNQNFRQEWKHYHLVKTVGQYELFERLPDA